MSLSNILSPNSYDLYCNNLTSTNVDLVTINHQPYPPGGGAIPNPLVANKLLRVNNTGTTMLWGDVNPSNLTGGSVGDVLKTVAPSTVAWDTIKPGDIAFGTPNQILHTNAGGTSAEWTSNLTVPGNANIPSGTLHVGGSLTVDSNSEFGQDLIIDNDLFVDNNISVVNGDISVLVGDTSLQNTDIAGNLTFNSVAGTNGQVVISNGLSVPSWGTLSISPSQITPGASYQLLQTDALGSVTNWVTDVIFPGNIAVNSPSISSLYETRQYGPLKLGGNFAGNTGAICVCDSSSVPHWEFPQYFGQYYQNGAVVDMNGAATVVLLQSAGTNQATANITFLNGVFTVAEAGQYLITFDTVASTSAAKTQVNFRINGSFAGSTSNIYIPLLTESQPLRLQKTFLFSNPNTTVEIVSEPVVAGTVNTSGTDSNGVATTLLTIQRLGGPLFL